MVGKVGQLSMDESLSLLQLKANSRLNSQAAASQTSVEVGRSSHVKRAAMQSPRDVQCVHPITVCRIRY